MSGPWEAGYANSIRSLQVYHSRDTTCATNFQHHLSSSDCFIRHPRFSGAKDFGGAPVILGQKGSCARSPRQQQTVASSRLCRHLRASHHAFSACCATYWSGPLCPDALSNIPATARNDRGHRCERGTLTFPHHIAFLEKTTSCIK